MLSDLVPNTIKRSGGPLAIALGATVSVVAASSNVRWLLGVSVAMTAVPVELQSLGGQVAARLYAPTGSQVWTPALPILLFSDAQNELFFKNVGAGAINDMHWSIWLAQAPAGILSQAFFVQNFGVQ